MPEDQTIHDFAEACTRVRAHGIPQPKIDWYKDGKLIDYGAVDERTKQNKYQVEFSAVSEEHMTSDFSICHFAPSDVGTVSFYSKKIRIFLKIKLKIFLLI